jgi:hypothetical protein
MIDISHIHILCRRRRFIFQIFQVWLDDRKKDWCTKQNRQVENEPQKLTYYVKDRLLNNETSILTDMGCSACCSSASTIAECRRCCQGYPSNRKTGESVVDGLCENRTKLFLRRKQSNQVRYVLCVCVIYE